MSTGIANNPAEDQTRRLIWNCKKFFALAAK